MNTQGEIAARLAVHTTLRQDGKMVCSAATAVVTALVT
jgi:hypothetical protein